MTQIVFIATNNLIDKEVDQDLLNISWVTYLKMAASRVGEEEEEDIEDIELQVT